MPIYDYLCQSCGPFEKRRAMTESQQPSICPTCGQPAPRMMTVVRLNLMPGNKHMAEERNERNAHEPGVLEKAGSREHVSQTDGKSGHVHHDHSRSFSRPWMIGH